MFTQKRDRQQGDEERCHKEERGRISQRHDCQRREVAHVRYHDQQPAQKVQEGAVGLENAPTSFKLHEDKAVSDRVTVLRGGRSVGTVNTADAEAKVARATGK